MYFLVAGRVQVELSEDPPYIWLVHPGQIFGEAALLTGMPLRAQAVALTDTEVLRIPNEAVHALLADPEVMDWVGMRAVETLRKDALLEAARPSSVARLVATMTQVEFHDVDASSPLFCRSRAVGSCFS